MKTTRTTLTWVTMAISLGSCNLDNYFSADSTDTPISTDIPLLSSKSPAVIISDLQPVEYSEPKIVFNKAGNGLMIWQDNENRVKKYKLYFSYYDANSNAWSLDNFFIMDTRPTELSLMALDEEFILVRHQSNITTSVFSPSAQQWQHLAQIEFRKTIYDMDNDAAFKNEIAPFDHINVGINTHCSDCHTSAGVLADLPSPALEPPPSVSGNGSVSGGGGGGGGGGGKYQISFGNKIISPTRIQHPGNLFRHIIKSPGGFSVAFQQLRTTIVENSASSERIIGVNVYKKNATSEFETTGTLIIESEKTQTGQIPQYYNLLDSTQLAFNDEFAAIVWRKNIENKTTINSRLIDLTDLSLSETETVYETDAENNVDFTLSLNRSGLALAVFHNKPAARKLELSLCKRTGKSCKWTSIITQNENELVSTTPQTIKLMTTGETFNLITGSSIISLQNIAYIDSAWQLTQLQSGDPDGGLNYQPLFTSDSTLYTTATCDYSYPNRLFTLNLDCTVPRLIEFDLTSGEARNESDTQLPDSFYRSYSIALNNQGKNVFAHQASTTETGSTILVSAADDPHQLLNNDTNITPELNATASHEPEIIYLSDNDFLVMWKQDVSDVLNYHIRPYINEKWGEIRHLNKNRLKYSVTNGNTVHFSFLKNSKLNYFHFDRINGFSEPEIISSFGSQSSDSQSYSPIVQQTLIGFRDAIYIVFVKYTDNVPGLYYTGLKNGVWSDSIKIQNISQLRSDLDTVRQGEKIHISYIDFINDKYQLQTTNTEIGNDGNLKAWSEPITLLESDYIISEPKLSAGNLLNLRYSFLVETTVNRFNLLTAFHYYDHVTGTWSDNIAKDKMFSSLTVFLTINNSIVVLDGSGSQLVFIRYDLDKAAWSTATTIYNLPDDRFGYALKATAINDLIHAFWESRSPIELESSIHYLKLNNLEISSHYLLHRTSIENNFNYDADVQLKTNGNIILIYTGIDQTKILRNQYIPVIYGIPNIVAPE